MALSSAEAELYAMVAASTEALAVQAYAKDLGMELGNQLYTDSFAAIGIAKRAGIGKARHLRMQGLWIQEVRATGRISHKKILGEKNPADLLTKHLTADVIKRHQTTITYRTAEGRAEAAPTLDSIEDDGVEARVQRLYEKRFHFSETVDVRPIPASGRGRSCKKQEYKSQQTKWVEKVNVYEQKADKNDKGAQSMQEMHEGNVGENKKRVMQARDRVNPGEHTCGIGSRTRWADQEDDDTPCPDCARQVREAEEWAEVLGACGNARSHGPAPAAAAREWAEGVGAHGGAKAHGPAPAMADRDGDPSRVLVVSGDIEIDSLESERITGECAGDYVVEHGGTGSVTLGFGDAMCRLAAGGNLVEGETEVAGRRQVMELALKINGQLPTNRTLSIHAP